MANISARKWNPMLRALESRNYRLFFIGQGISLIGTWITQVASMWLVYDLTNSPLLLGIVGFAGQIPSCLLTPFGGVVVDRWNRHRIVVGTQILFMLHSLTLAGLALTGIINIWHIIVLSVFHGLVLAFDIPARQALVVEMVEKRENLGNAIALNSSIYNGAKLIGPAIAGLLVAAVGAGVCFLIDGISFIAVIASLLAIKIKPREIAVTNTHPLQRLKEGFVYAFGFPPIRALLLLSGLVNCMGMSYSVLVPVFATKILHGDSETLGFLMAANGVGALIGGIYLTSRTSVVGLGKVIAYSPAISGIGLIAFAVSRTLWLSLLMMLIVGFGSLLQLAASNTVLQTIVEDDKRGRVFSLFAMTLIGAFALGNLFAGSLASHIGASHTLIIAGMCCILGSFIFARQLPGIMRLIRPIYTKMGIIT